MNLWRANRHSLRPLFLFAGIGGVFTAISLGALASVCGFVVGCSVIWDGFSHGKATESLGAVSQQIPLWFGAVAL